MPLSMSFEPNSVCAASPAAQDIRARIMQLEAVHCPTLDTAFTTAATRRAMAESEASLLQYGSSPERAEPRFATVTSDAQMGEIGSFYRRGQASSMATWGSYQGDTLAQARNEHEEHTLRDLHLRYLEEQRRRLDTEVELRNTRARLWQINAASEDAEKSGMRLCSAVDAALASTAEMLKGAPSALCSAPPPGSEVTATQSKACTSSQHAQERLLPMSTKFEKQPHYPQQDYNILVAQQMETESDPKRLLACQHLQEVSFHGKNEANGTRRHVHLLADGVRPFRSEDTLSEIELKAESYRYKAEASELKLELLAQQCDAQREDVVFHENLAREASEAVDHARKMRFAESRALRAPLFLDGDHCRSNAEGPSSWSVLRTPETTIGSRTATPATQATDSPDQTEKETEQQMGEHATKRAGADMKLTSLRSFIIEGSRSNHAAGASAKETNRHALSSSGALSGMEYILGGMRLHDIDREALARLPKKESGAPRQVNTTSNTGGEMLLSQAQGNGGERNFTSKLRHLRTELTASEGCGFGRCEGERIESKLEPSVLDVSAGVNKNLLCLEGHAAGEATFRKEQLLGTTNSVGVAW